MQKMKKAINRCFSLLTPLLVLSLCQPPAAVARDDTGTELQRHLQSLNSSRQVWPLHGGSSSGLQVNWTVTFDFVPFALVDLDSARQSLKLLASLQVEWLDEILVWDLARYPEPVTSQRPSQIWYPSVVLHNAVDSSGVLRPLAPVRLFHVNPRRSRVRMIFRQEFEVGCLADTRQFPRDTQSCSLMFAVLCAPPGLTLAPLREIPTGSYVPHSEWKLTNVSTETGHQLGSVYGIYEPDRQHAHVPVLIVRLQFQRVGDFYQRNLVLPVCMLTVLQVVIFAVPAQPSRKLSLGSNILLGFILYLLLFDQIIPKSQQLPSIFFAFHAALILSVTAIVLAACVLIMHHRRGCGPPAWLWLLLLRLVQGCVMLPAERLRADARPQQQWQAAARTADRLLTIVAVVVAAVCIANFSTYT